MIALFPLCGCGKSFKPQTAYDFPSAERIQNECQEKVCVSAAIPGPDETRKIFGYPLEKKGMQPVWLEIKNQSGEEIYLLPVSIDPEYFPPFEAAYRIRQRFSPSAQRKIETYFNEKNIHRVVKPGETRSGFVFTHVDRDGKMVGVDLVGETDLKRFSFIIPVPGFHADYKNVDLANLYTKDQMTSYDLEELRRVLEKFPCCTEKKGQPKGDAVNLVMIGNDDDLFTAFVRSGWRETESGKGTGWKTLASYLNRGKYEYAPMSNLYLLGRHQDTGLQKPRETPHSRNHLRLWLTPYRFEGKPVWIGTISRDIGLKWTLKSPYFFITHKIDPDIDETRDYLLEDLISSGSIEKVGWIRGVGEVSRDQPRKDPMGNPYFTDGLRVVLFISNQPVEYAEVDFLDWEQPPPH